MKTLFSLDGRMKRSTFIRGYLAVTSAWLVAPALVGCVADKAGWTELRVIGLVAAPSILYYVLFLRLCVLRLHDIGRSGWRYLFAPQPYLYRDLFLAPSVSTNDGE